MKPDLLASHVSLFSLHQSWVLGTLKVAWLLAAFIAIVTYTPRLTCSGARLRSQTDQSDVSKVTHVWHKSLPQFLFLQIKGHYEVS